MKKIIAAISFTLLTLLSFGQANYEDVVYLKNGSIIRGVITEQVPNESVKIKTRDNNVFVYKADEILKITREEIKQPGRMRKEKTSSFSTETMKQRGYTNITEFTFGRSFANSSTEVYYGNSYNVLYTDYDNMNNGPVLAIHTINGYQFSPHFSLGLGIGMHVHAGLVLVPFFADARYNFMKKRTSPFVAVEAGYAYARKEITGGSLASEFKGGLHFSSAAGVKFFVSSRSALNLSVGYRYQEIKEPAGDNPNYVGTSYFTRILRSGFLRFGFTF